MQRLICALYLGVAWSQVAFAAPATGGGYGLHSNQDALIQQQDGQGQQVERFLVETAPGETKWVTEEEKLDMIRVSKSEFA